LSGRLDEDGGMAMQGGGGTEQGKKTRAHCGRKPGAAGKARLARGAGYRGKSGCGHGVSARGWAPKRGLGGTADLRPFFGFGSDVPLIPLAELAVGLHGGKHWLRERVTSFKKFEFYHRELELELKCVEV
jgi:hypothetical protein